MDETKNIAPKKERGDLYDFITSDRNIYRAIYALESYIDEPYLLGEHLKKEMKPGENEEKNPEKKDDLELYYKLSDKFNWELIDETIVRCQDKLHKILTDPKELFDVEVYFRLKKFDDKSKKLKYRPLHTARLIDLICMVAILQVLMFEDSDENEKKPIRQSIEVKEDVHVESDSKAENAETSEKSETDEQKDKKEKNTTTEEDEPMIFSRNLSDLSKSIPHNFYGNKPSNTVDRIFQKWQTNYQRYNQLIVGSSREFRKSHKYNYEVSLDIKNFFPSISPFYIHSKVCHELCNRYIQKEDIHTLRIAVAKLLFLNVTSKAVENEKFGYYYNSDLKVAEFLKSTQLRLAKGVAQGLPQSYFFGNICMSDIRRVIATRSKFKGLDYFYVDDSVIYIGKDFEPGNFKQSISNLNECIEKKIESVIDATTGKNKENQPASANNEAQKKDDSLSPSIIDHAYIKFHKPIKYKIEFHEEGKSTCRHIDNTEPLFGLEGIDRLNSATDFFNLDEVDDFISIEKMKALNNYIDMMIAKAKDEAQTEEKAAKAKGAKEVAEATPDKEPEQTNEVKEAKQGTESKEAKKAEQTGQAD